MNYSHLPVKQCRVSVSRFRLFVSTDHRLHDNHSKDLKRKKEKKAATAVLGKEHHIKISVKILKVRAWPGGSFI